MGLLTATMRTEPPIVGVAGGLVTVGSDVSVAVGTI